MLGLEEEKELCQREVSYSLQSYWVLSEQGEGGREGWTELQQERKEEELQQERKEED